MKNGVPYLARLVSNLTGRASRVGYAAAAKLAGRSLADEDPLRRYLSRERATAIDVGANVGQTAAGIFEVCPTARVLSVDPIPENVEACRRRFGDRPGFRAVQAALGEESTGTATFRVLPFSQASSLFPLSKVAKETFRSLAAAPREITVPTRRLDDLVADAGFERIDFLKVDVEGAEAGVLRGGRETLRRSRALLVETQVQAMHEGAETFDEVCHLARGAGLRFAAVTYEFRDLFGKLMAFDLLFERSAEGPGGADAR